MAADKYPAVTDRGERPAADGTAGDDGRDGGPSDGGPVDAAAAFRDAMVERLSRYDRLVEVGIGRRGDVAGALAAAGKAVTAVDVHPRDAPDGVSFVRDDVVAASERGDPGAAYRADAVYALNLPAELQKPTVGVARTVGADCLFTTLGFEAPVVPARRESVGGDVLYVVERRH